MGCAVLLWECGTLCVHVSVPSYHGHVTKSISAMAMLPQVLDYFRMGNTIHYMDWLVI